MKKKEKWIIKKGRFCKNKKRGKEKKRKNFKDFQKLLVPISKGKFKFKSLKKEKERERFCKKIRK